MNENKQKVGLGQEVASLVKTNIRDYMMYIALVVIMVFFAIKTNGGFLQARNIANLINQAGYVAVMAIGIFAGYTFMTKDGEIDTKIGLLICAIVMLIGIYFAVRTSWCLEIASLLQDQLGMTKGSLTSEESEVMYKLLGIRDTSFSEISSEFSVLLEKCDAKGDFIGSLAENAVFAALGGIGTFAKFGKGRI